MYLMILMNIEIFWKYFGLSINGIFLVFFVESSSLQLVAYLKKWSKKTKQKRPEMSQICVFWYD